MRHVETVILGAGLSGLSTAYSLKGRDFLVIEKSDHVGGLCTSEQKNGFSFDQTGHWLHMRDNRTKKLFNTLFDDEYVTIDRKTFVFSHDTYTLYPFQSNTYGLPPQVIKECIIGFIKAQYEADKSKAKENFYEWCMAYLGEGISKHFMIPYNSKIYTVHPKKMASHWCDYYVPKPTLEQVIDGAITAPEQKVGYNASFSYPEKGGIGDLVKRLFNVTEKEKYLFETWPVSINYQKKELTTNHGEIISYKHLISSAPLKDFLYVLEGDKKHRMKTISDNMQIASVSYLNVGINRELGHKGHWFYIPEQKYMPYRIGSFSNIYCELAPKNKSSLYVEYTHQGDFNQIEKFKEETIKMILDMKLIDNPDKIAFMDYRMIKNGYVIFHDSYFDDMQEIQTFSEAHQIHHIGRYGRWTYNAMENAIIDGMSTAEKIKK